MDLIWIAFENDVRLCPMDGGLTIIAPPRAAWLAVELWNRRDEVLCQLSRLGHYGPPGLGILSECLASVEKEAKSTT